MSNYPEHDKMAAVKNDSTTIGAFLEWMVDSSPYLVAEYSNGKMQPVGLSIEQLLAEYFEVDLKKIDKEKDQMLLDLRANIAIESW